jgi:type II secretory pathway pseudopilin PulG
MIVRVRLGSSATQPSALGTRHSRRGLSLLEVLAALAVFLFSLIALGQLITLGGDRARDVQWLSRATLIAQTKMAEVVAGAVPLTGQPDTPAEDDPDWSWSVEAAADNTPGLYLVTVRVSRPQPNGERFETTLSQYVLDPAQRGNTDGTTTDTTDTGTTTGTTGTGGTGG